MAQAQIPADQKHTKVIEEPQSMHASPAVEKYTAKRKKKAEKQIEKEENED